MFLEHYGIPSCVEADQFTKGFDWSVVREHFDQFLRAASVSGIARPEDLFTEKQRERLKSVLLSGRSFAQQAAEIPPGVKANGEDTQLKWQSTPWVMADIEGFYQAITGNDEPLSRVIYRAVGGDIASSGERYALTPQMIAELLIGCAIKRHEIVEALIKQTPENQDLYTAAFTDQGRSAQEKLAYYDPLRFFLLMMEQREKIFGIEWGDYERVWEDGIYGFQGRKEPTYLARILLGGEIIPLAEKNVLTIGPGAGADEMTFLHAGIGRLITFDVSQTVRKQLRKLFQKNGETVNQTLSTFFDPRNTGRIYIPENRAEMMAALKVLAEYLKDREPEDKMDLIEANSVFHLLEFPKGFKELIDFLPRVMKPGGIFAFTMREPFDEIHNQMLNDRPQTGINLSEKRITAPGESKDSLVRHRFNLDLQVRVFVNQRLIEAALEHIGFEKIQAYPTSIEGYGKTGTQQVFTTFIYRYNPKAIIGSEASNASA